MHPPPSPRAELGGNTALEPGSPPAVRTQGLRLLSLPPSASQGDWPGGGLSRGVKGDEPSGTKPSYSRTRGSVTGSAQCVKAAVWTGLASRHAEALQLRDLRQPALLSGLLWSLRLGTAPVSQVETTLCQGLTQAGGGPQPCLPTSSGSRGPGGLTLIQGRSSGLTWLL